jgi:hypothetical protein
VTRPPVSGPGRLPIGILPGSVPDDPAVPTPAQPHQPPPPVQMPMTARAIAAKVTKHLEMIEHRLKELVDLAKGPTINFLSAGTVAGGGTIGTTPQGILNPNPRRRGLAVQNIGAAGNLTIGLGTTAPISNQGLTLEPGQTWNGQLSSMLWPGSVSVIGSQAGVVYTFVEAMGGPST